VVVLVVLVMLLSVTLSIAVRSSREATRQRDEAVALRAAGEAVTLAASDPRLAAKVALAAHTISPHDQVRDALLAAHAAGHAIQSAEPGTKARDFSEVSPHGTYALDGGRLDATPLWRLSGGKASPVSLLPKVSYATFSGDEKTLVHLGPGNTEVRDISNASAPRLVTTLPLRINPTGISNDGKTLVGVKVESKEVNGGLLESVGPNVEASLWRLNGSRAPEMVPIPCASSGMPVLRPDGRMVTTVCVESPQQRAVRTWRIEPDGLHEMSAWFVGDSKMIVRYSPTGRFLILRMLAEPRVEVLDVTDPAAPRTWTEFTELRTGQTELVFGRDDAVVATLGTDGVVLWNIRYERAQDRLASYRGVDASRATVRYRPDHDEFVGAIASAGGQLWRFPLDVARARKTLCDGENVTLTDEEWDRYLHGVERVPVC
jgi:hypothetical protein